MHTDVINRPAHYTSHPSGIEQIQISEHLGFRLGNAFKYVFRAGQKDDMLQDLKKARYYLLRELNFPFRNSRAHINESLFQLLEQVTINEPDEVKASYFRNVFYARFGMSKQFRHTSCAAALQLLEEMINTETVKRQLSS